MAREVFAELSAGLIGSGVFGLLIGWWTQTSLTVKSQARVRWVVLTAASVQVAFGWALWRLGGRADLGRWSAAGWLLGFFGFTWLPAIVASRKCAAGESQKLYQLGQSFLVAALLRRHDWQAKAITFADSEKVLIEHQGLGEVLAILKERIQAAEGFVEPDATMFIGSQLLERARGVRDSSIDPFPGLAWVLSGGGMLAVAVSLLSLARFQPM